MVAEGTIEAVLDGDTLPPGCALIEAGSSTVLPGVVDTHVHINDPGRADWEGFETATRAAAAGGITTVVDMPLNSDPVTTTADAVRAKTDAISGRCCVDVGIWGGLTPDNASALAPMLDAGVLGVKCFLVHSGIDDFPAVGEHELHEAMPMLARAGVPLLVHAESPLRIRMFQSGDVVRRYAHYLASRPPTAEVEAISMMIELANKTRCHVHIVHLATAAALEMIAMARTCGVPITVETCPHYLTFMSEQIPDGATLYKCAPPIRTSHDRAALWNALCDGTIDLVASDHSPCPPAMKHIESGDFASAWGGIASLQFSLPAVLTGAAQRAIPLEEVVRWMCEAPARLAGLGSRKGAIRPGYDADIVVLDLQQTFTVDARRILHRHAATPYIGMELRGVVKSTYVRGQLVYDHGTHTGATPGILLERKRSIGS